MLAPETTLEHERAHLQHSREALRQMREASASISTVAGDPVSTAYLRQTLYRRMRSLEDSPTVPLFFGRLDYRTSLGAERDERLYVGRRHVTAEVGGDPLVVDWRAPVALPFYQARPGEPMGVGLRRRFGFSHGELTGYEDEDLTRPTGGASQLLADEIERPRAGPMRDIVATIQPDQDLLVRADLGTSLCIQGAPGTGKTAVGLHRAAYLLYTHRDQLSRQGVLVVGPNESFLGYIGDVLPALGEIDARQVSIESLLAESSGVRLRGSDPTEVALLKGDHRMAQVLDRAVWGQLVEPDQVLAVPYGSRTVRLSAQQVASAVAALRERGVRYESGRRLLPQRLAHEVLVRLEASGEVTDDRVQNRVARSGPVTRLCAQVWPQLSAPRLLHRLLSDPALLAQAADGLLSAEEQRLLLWPRPPRSPGSVRWSLPDLALLDEVCDLLVRTGSLGHVVLDEAQDLSPMMLRAVGRRAATGSVTVLGDLAQATTAWGARDWRSVVTHLGKPEATVTELVEGFRVPGAVIDYAARLLPRIAPQLAAPRSVRRSRGELSVLRVESLAEALPRVVAEVAAREGTVGLITPDALLPLARAALAATPYTELGQQTTTDDLATHLELVPASLAKGLEFDHVLLLEPARVVAAEADEVTGWRRLYVCLTRVVTSLVVLHAEDLPGELDR